MSEKIWKIDPKTPQKEIIDAAVYILKNGGVVAFPTRSLYGLGVDALNPKAVQKIFEIKKRPKDKPILVLVKNREAIRHVAKDIPRSAMCIMDSFWPGNVTLVLEANAGLPELLTAGTGKIGVRVPHHPVARALVNRMESPITGTSANISGEKGFHRVSDIDAGVISKLDLILDAGLLKTGKGSTVVDVTVHPPKVLREGEIPAGDILKLFSES